MVMSKENLSQVILIQVNLNKGISIWLNNVQKAFNIFIIITIITIIMFITIIQKRFDQMWPAEPISTFWFHHIYHSYTQYW